MPWRVEKQNWAFSFLSDRFTWCTSNTLAICLNHNNLVHYCVTFIWYLTIFVVYIKQCTNLNQWMHWEREESSCKLEQLFSQPHISQQINDILHDLTGKLKIFSNKILGIISFVPAQCLHNLLLYVCTVKPTVLMWCKALIRNPLMLSFCLFFFFLIPNKII